MLNGFKCFSQKSEPSVSVAEERVVVGGGGREHALCHALKRSPSCDAVFCAPGNVGISGSGDATCIPDLDIFDSSAVIAFCRQWGVGPEAPLVSGLPNYLVKAGIPTFGPSSEAAALEGSKNFMKSCIILPTVEGMSAEGCKFVGVLFAGLMIEKKSGLPKLIEYNLRFGDSECQVGEKISSICLIHSDFQAISFHFHFS